MIRYCTLLFSFFIIVCLSSCNPSPSGAGKKENCRIGVNLPLTGNAASWGSEYKKGLEAGFTAYNDTTSINPVQVIYEDNQFNARQAVNIIKKFLEIDRVHLILTGYTPIVKATMDMVNQAETPLLATLTSADGITDGKPWVFRDFVLESNYMPALAEFAYHSAHLRKGSSLVVNDDFGLDALKFFQVPFERFGGQMSAGAVFEESEMDLRNKVNKILSGNPDFILLVGRGSAMINGCRQIREMNPDIPIYSSISIHYEAIWNSLGTSGDGIVFGGFPMDEDNPEYQVLDQLFMLKYGSSFNWINLYGYTTANYLCEMIHKGATDKLKLKEALDHLNTESLRGTIIMNHEREVIPAVSIFKRENNRIVQFIQ